MATLQDSLNYLDAHGLRYAHTTHSRAYTAEEVAAAEHMPRHRMAKTVVCRDNDGYLMVVVPADSYVDLDQLRTAIGVPTLSVASESDLQKLFPGAEVGAMPPLGMLFDLRVYLDREVANQEFIAFNAGTHRDLIHMGSPISSTSFALSSAISASPNAGSAKPSAEGECALGELTHLAARSHNCCLTFLANRGWPVHCG